MAGIAEALFGKENPFAQWANSNSARLGALGAGLASGTSLGGSFANAAMMMPQARMIDDERAYKAAESQKAEQQLNETIQFLRASAPDLATLVEAGMPPQDAWAEAMRRQQPQEPPEMTANQRDYLFAQENPGFSDFLGQGNGASEFGLTPIWGQLPDGSFAYGVQGKDGTFRRVETGEMKMLDPRSLNYERGFGGATGKAAGEGQAAAPGDIAAGNAALGIIDQIKTSPELGWATGTSAGLGGNAIPGTGRYGFQNLVDQAKSGAFLTAVQEMRGLGALSNAEGSAATQAITRINTALSKEDFLKALDDYEAIVRRGIARAQARLQGIGVQPQVTASGVQWSVDQ